MTTMHPHCKGRQLACVVWALCLTTAVAQAQTGRLNDTGQTSCYNASNVVVTCDAATAGNAGTRPHQDGRYGRDAAQAAGALPAKTGGGAAGFDFSCVLWNGTVVNGSNCTAGLVANTTGTASGTPGTDWACTKDNVTGLVWSLQTQTASWNTASDTSYPNAGHNTPSRCGYSTGWRLPTRRELLSIVHNDSVNSPAINSTFIPRAPIGTYWTVSASQGGPTSQAWGIYFGDGSASWYTKADIYFVRLVHSEQ